MLTILEQLVALNKNRPSITPQADAREQRTKFLLRVLKSHPKGKSVRELMTLLAVSQATVCDMLNELQNKGVAKYYEQEVAHSKSPIRFWILVDAQPGTEVHAAAAHGGGASAGRVVPT